MIPCLAAGSCLYAQPWGSQEEDPGRAALPGCSWRGVGFFGFFLFCFLLEDNSCDLLALLPGTWRSGPAHGCSWAVSCFRVGRIQLALAARWESEIRRDSSAPPAPSALRKNLLSLPAFCISLSAAPSIPLDLAGPGGGMCKRFSFYLF